MNGLRMLCGIACLTSACIAQNDLLPPAWTEFGRSGELQTAYTSNPWSDTSIFGHLPRTSTLDVTVGRCWSESGKQLSEDYCLEQALRAAFTVALTSLDLEHNTTAIEGRDLKGTPRIVESSAPGYEKVDLEFDGHAFRPVEARTGTVRRSNSGGVPLNIKYSGMFSEAFLYRRRSGNHSIEQGTDLPIFVASNGSQHEVVHLHRPSISTRDSGALEDDVTYEAGRGIKVQSHSEPITTCEYVQDWMNSNAHSEDSSTGSILDYLMFVAKHVGYLGFSLKDGEAGKDGKFIMVAESFGFGVEWEQNWNWCLGSGDTSECSTS